MPVCHLLRAQLLTSDVICACANDAASLKTVMKEACLLLEYGLSSSLKTAYGVMIGVYLLWQKRMKECGRSY